MFPIGDTVPRRRPAFVVWALILANGVVFWYQLSLSPGEAQALAYRWALVPLRYTDPAWAAAHGLDPHDYLPFLTNTFMHGGWAHIVGNMWTLWLFGSAVEDRLGHGRFFAYYLLSGLAASWTHYLFNATSAVPALGASGAIAGVIAGYAMLFPHARILFVVPVLFFPFFFDLPALVWAALWYLLQVFQGTLGLLRPGLGGAIAWWAHVGGFVTGGLLMLLLRRRIRARPYYRDETRLGYGPGGERS